MGAKLLFICGIIAAHGALAAGWASQEAPQARAAIAATCARTPGVMPDFTPRRMLLAVAVIPIDYHGEVERQ